MTSHIDQFKRNGVGDLEGKYLDVGVIGDLSVLNLT
jgi:hypothetical protein